MKIISIFIIILILAGCNSSALFNKTTMISCPQVLFSSEHRDFIKISSSTEVLEDILYKSNINNAIFTEGCFVSKNLAEAKLSILFISEILNSNLENSSIPFYLAFIDKNKKLIKIDYFLVEIDFVKNSEYVFLNEIETTKTINIESDLIDESVSIVIGFMLDLKKQNFYN